MKHFFSRLNIIFLLLIVGAIFGTLWFSRGFVRNWMEKNNQADIPVAVPRFQIQKEFPSSTAFTISTSSVSHDPKVSVPTTSTPEKSLPVSFNLDVPFVPQAPEKNWDEPWQDACEEAAILMMDAYEKDINTSVAYDKEHILSMVQWEEEKKWGLSIEIEKIQQIFRDYLQGYTKNKIHIVENPTLEQIKKYIVNGQPVLVVADGKTLPNPHFQNGGPPYHALVIRGYTADSFITNDPGTQFGENFKYKYQDLFDSIHDWNGGDVQNGRQVVLVIDE